MIAERDIANAMMQRLATAAIAPVYYENQDATPTARPFLFAEYVPTGHADPTIAGGAGQVTGFMSVTVVIAEGTFATAAIGLADQIDALFPKGLRLAVASGSVVISGKARRMKGYQDGSDYRLQVRVPFRAS